MDDFLASPWFYLLFAGVLGTQIWRWIGVMLGSKLDEESSLYRLTKAIATALIAAVVSTLIIFPTGSLITIPLFVRIAGLIAGFGVFVLMGQRLWLGLLTAVITLIGGALL